MAETVLIANHRPAKVRNPWAVFGLTLITLGIYQVFWYYRINREMADWGEATDTDLGDSPGTSVLAITLGAIILIPFLISVYHTGQRIERSQRAAGRVTISPGMFLLLTVIPFVSFLSGAYGQHQVNKVWRAQQSAPVEPLAA
jgi:hypothetical protein